MIHTNGLFLRHAKHTNPQEGFQRAHNFHIFKNQEKQTAGFTAVDRLCLRVAWRPPELAGSFHYVLVQALASYPVVLMTVEAAAVVAAVAFVLH